MNHDSLIFIVVLDNVAYKVKLLNSNSFRIFDLLVTFQTELKNGYKKDKLFIA